MQFCARSVSRAKCVSRVDVSAQFLLQVDQLNEKLAELEEERKELAEFQRLDKQRRALEFAIYDRDLSGTKAALEKVNTSAVFQRNAHWHDNTTATGLCTYQPSFFAVRNDCDASFTAGTACGLDQLPTLLLDRGQGVLKGQPCAHDDMSSRWNGSGRQRER